MEDFENRLKGHSFGGYMRDGGLFRDKAPEGEGGGKGGKKGGSSGGFTEDPNTIQSDAVFTCVDLLCEGPIEGLYYGLESIFLNNVPLYNTSGVSNFIGIVYDWRQGYVDQTHFVGMEVIENPIIVNARITSGHGDSDATAGGPPHAPFHFQCGQAAGPGVVNPDFIGITIQLNGLSVMDTKKGRLKGSSVSVSMWCQGSDMADYAKIGGDTISGKCTAPYQRSYVLTPVGLPPWTLKVERDSADFTKSTEVGDTYVFSYSVIFSQKLIYAYSACMSAYIDASQFGSSLPSRTYDILGLIVDVPSNYDPYARTYDGLWDGTFVQKWTNNPAWVCYSLLANKRWGLGKKIDQTMIDKWSLYTIGQYCDERVSDMFGGTECRFTFDGIVAGQQEAYTILNQVASCFRGMIYWGASGITFTQDAPSGGGVGHADETEFFHNISAPVALFSPANTLNGDFTYEGTSEKARHSIALVTYNDPRNDFKAAIEPVEISELVQRYGQRVIKVTAYGCSRRSQARRFGRWILASEQLETETVTFNTGLDYADIAPGSVIGIADPHRTDASMAGRIVYASATEVGGNFDIQIDRVFSFNFSGPNYDILYQNPSGIGVLRRLITDAVLTGDGLQQILKTQVYEDDVADTPITGSLFAIQQSGFADEITAEGDHIRLFRVIANKEIKTHEYQITAVEHNPAKFDIVDQEETLVPEGGTPWSSWAVGAPANFSAINTFGGGLADVALSWTAPQSPNPADAPGTGDPRIVLYQIFQLENAEWTMLATTAGLSYTVSGLAEGDYWFAVRAVTAVQIGPFSVLEDDAVSAAFAVPSDVTNLSAVVSYNDATLGWDENTSTGVSGYHLTRDGVTFADLTPEDNTSLYFVFTDANNHRYGIKAVTSTGSVSADETQVVFLPLVPPDPAGFAIDHILGQVVTFTFNNAPPLGCYYQIRQGASFDAGTIIQNNIFAASVNVTVVGTPTSLLFWCETFSNIGRHSNALSVGSGGGAILYDQAPFAIVDVVATLTTNHTFAGITANVAVEAVLGRNSTFDREVADIAVTSFITRNTSKNDLIVRIGTAATIGKETSLAFNAHAGVSSTLAHSP